VSPFLLVDRLSHASYGRGIPAVLLRGDGCGENFAGEYAVVEPIFNEQRLVAAAKRYAAADKSNPFAFARALCHIRFGLCGYTEDGKEGWYDAEEHSVARGCVVTSTFTNMIRP